MHHRHTGFTAIELLIALAIIAILASLTNHAFASARAATRSSHAKTVLHTALVAAQRHSVIHNRHIVLCASLAGERCSGSTHWETGWIGFIDLNRDRERQPDEKILVRETAMPDDVRVRSSSNRIRLVFQPNGGASAGSNVTFVVCDSRGPAKAAALVLANSGRIRQEAPSPERATTACR